MDTTIKDKPIIGYTGSAPVAGVGGAQVQGLGVTQNGATPITASSLAPATAYTLAPSVPQTASVGLATQATTYATQAKNQALKEEQQRVDMEKAQVESGANDIATLLGDIGGQNNKKVDAYAAGGLNDSKAKIDTITSDMEAADLKARRQIEEITNSNPNGMVGAGAQGEIQRIQRQNASYQADQAIVLSALGRNYDRAKGIIDAKIDAETEQMKANLDARKFFYEKNEKTFTKDEDRQYQASLTAEARKYAETVAEKTTLETTKADAYKILNENGRTDLIAGVTNAKDISSIYSAMKGVVSLDTIRKRADINKVNAEIAANLPVTGEWAGVINGASGLVANTKKTTVKTNISNALANGDYTTAYAEVKNAVSDGLTGTPKTKFDDANTDIAVLSGLRDVIQKYSDAGGDMGYLKGTAEEISRKFGQLKDDPKFTALAVELQREFQTYRQNMTGAAFSPGESREYASVNPTSDKGLDLNLAVIDGALNGLNNRVDGVVSQRIPDAKKIKAKINETQQNSISAKSKVDAYIKANPDKAETIAKLYETASPAFDNKPPTDEQIAEYLNL